jgi:hypothetical protein
LYLQPAIPEKASGIKKNRSWKYTAISMAIDDDRGNGTNWLLWSGLALLVVLIILAVPLLNQGQDGTFDQPGTQPGGEAEQAEEQVENNTTGNMTGQQQGTPTGTAPATGSDAQSGT